MRDARHKDCADCDVDILVVLVLQVKDERGVVLLGQIQELDQGRDTLVLGFPPLPLGKHGDRVERI